MTATAAFTHTAQKPHTGYTRRGRGAGHTDVNAGVVHAANRHTKVRNGWRFHGYLALCGEFVMGETENLHGDVTTDHVRPVCDGVAVTCRRCRKVIDAAK